MSVQSTEITLATDLKAAQRIANQVPGWLVTSDPEHVDGFLAVLEQQADAILYSRLHKELELNDCPHPRGGERWNAMVAEEMLRMISNLEAISESAKIKLITEIQRRRLFEQVFDNYRDLGQLLREQAPNRPASERSDMRTLAEVVIPWCSQHQDDGAPAPSEFWRPRRFQHLRAGIPLMVSVIQDEESTIEEKAQAIKQIQEVFTDPDKSLTEVRQIFNPPPPIGYTEEWQDGVCTLVFPKLDRTQHDMILHRLDGRVARITGKE